MQIEYKKKHMNLNLILGLVWFAWFWLDFFIKDRISWIDYGLFVISVAYLGLYFYQKKYKYLTIASGQIKTNSLFNKEELNLSEIKGIQKFAGHYYILKVNKSKKLKINTKIITPESLQLLDSELEKLAVKWV